MVVSFMMLVQSRIKGLSVYRAVRGNSMIIKHIGEYKNGYNPIAKEQEMAKMDFGVVTLRESDVYLNKEQKERALLLIKGHVNIEYANIKQSLQRESYLDDNPVCLHVPQKLEITITAQEKSEIAYFAVKNEKDFAPQVYTQKDSRTDVFGEGTLNETSLRYVRTIFDNNNAPYSNMVIGEVVNFPGKWSSYPPHHHVQPEIYYYKFFSGAGIWI